MFYRGILHSLSRNNTGFMYLINNLFGGSRQTVRGLHFNQLFCQMTVAARDPAAPFCFRGCLICLGLSRWPTILFRPISSLRVFILRDFL